MADIHEVATIIFMAFAVSMDAFSVSLGLGMQKLRFKRIIIIGLVIGFFHIMFPLLGMSFGKILSEKIGNFTTFSGGFLLIIIGAHMFFSAFMHSNQNQPKTFIQPVGFGLIILATTVSIDSFSIGLSLGMTGMQFVLTLILFGITGVLLTWCGLFIGRKVYGFLGAYSELLGGSILIAFGIQILFA